MAFSTGTFLTTGSILAAVVAYFYHSQSIGLAAHASVQDIAPQTCAGSLSSEDHAIASLRKIVSFETVSDVSKEYHVRKPENFVAMWAAVQAEYPLVWERLAVEQVGEGGLSRLLTWEGSDATKLPVIFISHVDVVPVQPETVGDWTHPPFSGALADGYVWGRGTLDVKVTVIAMLEAVTALLGKGYQPSRTLLFGFGHDEEVMGNLGAGVIAEVLRERYGAVEVVVDEGTVIAIDGLPVFTRQPVALVGTAEKGFTNAKVVITGPGGHSSMPPPGGATPIEAAGKMISGLSASPLPPVLQAPMTHFLQALAPEAPLYLRPLMRYAHLPIISSLWAQIFSRGTPQMACLVRTSTVPTIISAGIAANVIPQKTEFLVNIRTLPGVSEEDLLSYLRLVAAGPASKGRLSVTVEAPYGNPASKVTDPDGVYFQLLKRAVQETQQFDSKPVAVVPFMVSGGTDSKQYAELTRHGTLRFCPVRMNITAGDVGRVHGTDERIATANFLQAICSYTRILELFGLS